MASRVILRLYGDLSALAATDEDGRLDVPLGEPRSVKDLVESLGVPHTEVDLLLVDGEPAGFDHRLEGGERVAVFPLFGSLDVGAVSRVRPPTPHPHRFVLDVHLGRLATLLRLLGFDTGYRNDADDAELAAVAASERRTLLTRDRGLLMRNEVVHGYLVRHVDPEEQVSEVARRFDLAPEVEPFTRCLACNGLLRDVPKAEVTEAVPPRAWRDHDRFARCEGCRRVYWPGSHYDRLARLVERLTPPAAGSPGAH